MRESFNEWLAREHPDVWLTRMQSRWVERMEAGSEYDGWIGGRLTGHTFVRKLWNEYKGITKETK